MPIYTIELDGKQYDIEGDRPPTEEEARQAVGEFSQPVEQPKEQESILQMLLSNAKQAGIQTLEQAKDIGNVFTLGGANALYKGITGQEWVDKSKIPPMNQLADQLLGLSIPANAITSGIMKLGQAVTTPQKIAQAATIGGTLGFVMPPETSFSDLKERGKQAILGALVGVAAERTSAGLDKLTGLSKEVTSKEQANLARRIRKSFLGVKQGAVDKFDNELTRLTQNKLAKGENPDIDINDIVVEARGVDIDEPAKKILSKIPKLGDMIKSIEHSTKISLRDLQNTINYIDNNIPHLVKQQHFDLIDIRNSLKAAQLDVFPEMAKVRTEYGKVLEPYNQIKGQFKFNRLINAMKNGFGGPEGEDAVRELFSDKPDVLKSINKFRTLVKTTKIGKDVLFKLLQAGAIGVGAGSAYTVGRKVLE